MIQQPSLQSLQRALEDLRTSQVGMPEFCRTWRAQTALLAALPPQYGQVMEDLLGRMEAGALFTEESCSFSQNDLQAQLAVWLDKATQHLARG